MPTVPTRARNLLTLAGAILAVISALLFIAFFTIEVSGLFGVHGNPYLGIVFFIVLPSVFVAGLLMMPAGILLERHRRARGLEPSLRRWPRLDLNDVRIRQAFFVVVVLTPVNILIVSMAAYKGVEAMDSVAFCGQVCHEVMEPEFVAYQDGPHARVKCVECHIGPGADWFARSKLSGARQVVAVLMNSHSRPIPSPVHHLRPSRDTCEQCHWPAQFHGDKVETLREYSEDEANTELVTSIRLRIGGIDRAGRPQGIHWHVAEENQIEYIALDEARQQIVWVQQAGPNGTVIEYRAEGVTDEQLAQGQRRRMDCVDCHNRPSHIFARSVERSVNELIAAGAVPRSLPFIRREGVAVLKAEYPTKEAARAAIAEHLTSFYRSNYPEVWTSRQDEVMRAVAELQGLYHRNVFPSMRVTWGTHPDNRGHMEFPGCFRCHDDSHKAPDGRVIRQDCSLCHEIS
ncbi:MAG: NapC/NirT family cytochrome c [Acidobacteriota bacterium]